MIVKVLGKTALAIVASFIGVGIGMGAAQAGEPIERSGNVYHQAVCSREIEPGEARCFAHIRVDAHGNPFIGNPDSRTGTPSGYSPSSLWSAYFGGTQTPLTLGGTVVAIVDAYGYANAASDLAVYRAQYGLGPCSTGCFKQVNQTGVSGNYPRYNAGWAQEQALDLDMVSAMCPKCSIILVEAKSASFSDLNAAVAEAAVLGAKVISNSYGGADSASTNYDVAEPAYKNAAKAGVAVTASAGDSGYGAQFPATSEYTIAVGGTSLTTTSNGGWSNIVWSGTGSGCSSRIGSGS